MTSERRKNKIENKNSKRAL